MRLAQLANSGSFSNTSNVPTLLRAPSRDLAPSSCPRAPPFIQAPIIIFLFLIIRPPFLHPWCHIPYHFHFFLCCLSFTRNAPGGVSRRAAGEEGGCCSGRGIGAAAKKERAGRYNAPLPVQHCLRCCPFLLSDRELKGNLGTLVPFPPASLLCNLTCHFSLFIS